MSADPALLLVLTTLPDRAAAERLARLLLEQRLVACASLQAPCQSLYHWQGQLESAEEIPLLLKTTADHYPALEAAIRAAHPYELPEIIALPASAALFAYAQWVFTETHPASS